MAGSRFEYLIAKKVATLWLDRKTFPPASKCTFSLPVALVATLKVGNIVQGVNGCVYIVSTVGPGLIVLDSPEEQVEFSNQGFHDYSWAYFAAPFLHWIISD